MTRLPPIRRRAEAATEGPWESCWEIKQLGNYGEKYAFGYVKMGGHSIHVMTCTPESMDKNGADMEFISKARQDVPYLLGLVDQLRGALEACKQAVMTGPLYGVDGGLIDKIEKALEAASAEGE